MLIALFGKQTTIEKVEHHHHYYNPIIVPDKETAQQIAEERTADESAAVCNLPSAVSPS